MSDQNPLPNATPPTIPRHRVFRSFILSLVLFDVLLVLLGLVLYPKVIKHGGLLGASAAASMVACYGFVALYSPIRLEKADTRLWKTSAAVGIAGGVWLGSDLLSNYFIYRDGPTNSTISTVVYGVYVLLLVGTAARGGAITQRIRGGLIAAFWYALTAQLIWLFVEFSAYYLFSRTRVGIQFIQTEMQADFERSGMPDFLTFVIGDFFGAGFFHLLLIGLVAALLFGSIGAMIGKSIATLRGRSS